MARIRTIKPEFWMDEDLAEVSETARLMAIALLNMADDEGWFRAHPALVQSSCFPFHTNSTTVPECLSELAEIGYISIHTGSDGKEYGVITNFTAHQRISKPQKSKIAPLVTGKQAQVIDSKETDTHSATVPHSFHTHSATVPHSVAVGKEQGTGNREQGMEQGKGRGVGKGKPRAAPKSGTVRESSGNDPGTDAGSGAAAPKKSRSRSSPFRPPTISEVRQYANERGSPIDPEQFVDHYTANGWMRGKTKIRDWKACFRTWEKNSKARHGTGRVIDLGGDAVSKNFDHNVSVLNEVFG